MMSTFRPRRLRWPLALLLAALPVASASAIVVWTWTGRGTTTGWFNFDNWDVLGDPASSGPATTSDDAEFPGGPDNDVGLPSQGASIREIRVSGNTDFAGPTGTQYTVTCQKMMIEGGATTATTVTLANGKIQTQ